MPYRVIANFQIYNFLNFEVTIKNPSCEIFSITNTSLFSLHSHYTKVATKGRQPSGLRPYVVSDYISANLKSGK